MSLFVSIFKSTTIHLAISFFDATSCVLLILSCYARTICMDNLMWMLYDTMIFIPVSGVVSTVSNFLTISVSLGKYMDNILALFVGINQTNNCIDRVIFMKNSKPRSIPMFCHLSVAKRIIALVVVVSLVLNSPYFFIFKLKDDIISATDFFYSE